MCIRLTRRMAAGWPLIAVTVLSLIGGLITPPAVAAQTVLDLPEPGRRVMLSAPYAPARLMGVNVDPQRPLAFDFIIDQGDDLLQGERLEQEGARLVKYFLAALTVPEDEMWVNLSPYEEDRIIPSGFGRTQMGRDLLALDYMLKQLSSSLMHPDDHLGHAFWQRVHQQAQLRFGTTDIPVNTFNKIWIVPEQAVVYEHPGGAFIVDSHLKVMLEEDYLALDANRHSTRHGLGELTVDDVEVISGVSGEIVREVLIPEIEREVNTGKTFAKLRQIYHSMLLASWYKNRLKESLLGQVYVDKQRTDGIDVSDRDINHKIYEQYVASFKKGVFNLIREDTDPATDEVIPRKYFSGGVELNGDQATLSAVDTARDVTLRRRVRSAAQRLQSGLRLSVGLNETGQQRTDRAMLTHEKAVALGVAQRIAREEADQTSAVFRQWYNEVLSAFTVRNNMIYGYLEGNDALGLEAYLQFIGNDALSLYNARNLLKKSVDNRRPTLLELGAGDTGVALAIARQNPDIDVVATDVWQTNPENSLRHYVADANTFEEGLLPAQTAGLDNLAAVRAQADLVGHLPDGSLDYILLVNPSRGAINDLVVMVREFGLTDKLRPGGQIILKATNSVEPFFELMEGRFQFTAAEGYDVLGVDVQATAAWPEEFLKGRLYVGTRTLDNLADIFDPTIAVRNSGGRDSAVLANVRTVARQYEMDESVVQGILAAHIKVDAFLSGLLAAVRRQNPQTNLDTETIRRELSEQRLLRDGLVATDVLGGDLVLTEPVTAAAEEGQSYPVSDADLDDIVYDSLTMESFALQLMRFRPIALNRDRQSVVTENDLDDISARLEEYLRELDEAERRRVEELTIEEGMGRPEAVAWVLGEKMIAERRRVAVRSMEHSASAAVDPFEKLASLNGIFSLAAMTEGYEDGQREEFRAMANTLKQFQNQMQIYAQRDANAPDFRYDRMYDFEKRWQRLVKLIAGYLGMFRIQSKRVTPEQPTHTFLADQTALLVHGITRDLESQIAFAQGNLAHNRQRINLLEEVTAAADELARRRGYVAGYVAIEAGPQAAEAEIDVNPTWLSLIISNLVNNAHDEIKKQVAAGQRPGFRAGDIRIRLDYDEQSGALELVVHDTAGGINPDSPLLERRLGRTRLFEFGRTAGKEAGTGVGLAEVYHITRLMRWHLELAPQEVIPNTDAIGARFMITMPIAPKNDQAVLAARSDEVGGIDMNPALADIRFASADSRQAFHYIPPANMDVAIDVDGFVPVILTATPIRNVPLLLGLE